MSETVKLIIEIPKDMFEWFKNEEIIDEYDESALKQVFKNGIPLDDIKAEIKELTKAHCIQVMDREDIPLLALDIIEKYKGGSEC